MSRYTDEDVRRIGEEHTITLGMIIGDEQHNLDLFNLEVAKFRLKHGMSTELMTLYASMGRLSHYLEGLEKGTARLGGMWEDIVCPFQEMQDREENK